MTVTVAKFLDVANGLQANQFAVGERYKADSISDLDENYKQLMDKPIPVIMAVIGSDGRPNLTPMWFDYEGDKVERMAFGRVCLLGDAAFAARPHAGAGSAQAAEDGWALTAALAETPAIEDALAMWEAKRVALDNALVERTRDVGRRSQFENSWIPGDPDLMLGLRGPGD